MEFIDDNVSSEKIEEKVEEDIKAEGIERVMIEAEACNDYLKPAFEEMKMIDYSELYSYMDKKKQNDDYEQYMPYIPDDEEEPYESETISEEAVNRIIEEKILEGMLGFNQGKSTLAEQESFRIYKIFNKGLIELKYSMGIS